MFKFELIWQLDDTLLMCLDKNKYMNVSWSLMEEGVDERGVFSDGEDLARLLLFVISHNAWDAGWGWLECNLWMSGTVCEMS